MYSKYKYRQNWQIIAYISKNRFLIIEIEIVRSRGRSYTQHTYKKEKKMATFHNAHAVVVVVVQDYRAVGRSENLEGGQTVMWGSQICPPPPLL